MQVDGFALDAARRLVTEVHCSDGERVRSDLVIAGIGLVPNTELAAAAGLDVDDGILVDACSRTSDPAIFAAGDCTRFDSPLYGRRIRLESVPNALEQARCAAATLCGKERRHDGVPWFWSDQYELKLKMVGLSQGHDRFVLRGSHRGPARSAPSTCRARGCWPSTPSIASRSSCCPSGWWPSALPVDPERLADDSVPLKNQIAA